MGFEVVPLEPITTLNAGDEYYFALQPVPRDAMYNPKDYGLIVSGPGSVSFTQENKWYTNPFGHYYPDMNIEWLSTPILSTGFGPVYSIDTVIKIKAPSTEVYGFILGYLSSIRLKDINEDREDWLDLAQYVTPYQYLNSIWFPEESSIKIANESPIVLSKNNSSVQLNANISITPDNIDGNLEWRLHNNEPTLTMTADGVLELTDLNKELDEDLGHVECRYAPAGYPVYSKKQKYQGKFYWEPADLLLGHFYDSIEVRFENV